MRSKESGNPIWAVRENFGYRKEPVIVSQKQLQPNKAPVMSRLLYQVLPKNILTVRVHLSVRYSESESNPSFHSQNRRRRKGGRGDWGKNFICRSHRGSRIRERNKKRERERESTKIRVRETRPGWRSDEDCGTHRDLWFETIPSLSMIILRVIPFCLVHFATRIPFWQRGHSRKERGINWRERERERDNAKWMGIGIGKRGLPARLDLRHPDCIQMHEIGSLIQECSILPQIDQGW